ncbi:hypothetical protein BpHYR1_005926 [Brachionus plicatilis]|uniref:Uncharacterized protein n=1 Tax=Brachionus plicatilis TaxID=10195 RepID=A0A3M7S302_BRAPC|nr:hypothetical protein BpHYR1_005926 [Brachionus plicatilis]
MIKNKTPRQVKTMRLTKQDDEVEFCFMSMLGEYFGATGLPWQSSLLVTEPLNLHFSPSLILSDSLELEESELSSKMSLASDFVFALYPFPPNL